MIYQYKCANKECKLKDEIQERSMPMSESSSKQYCKECKEEIQKVWNFNGGIKTSDGYKG